MKTIKLLLIFIIIAASNIRVSADNSFFVYKTDGSIESIFYSTLEKISFSNRDNNNVYYDYPVVQEFHTTDSIYRIPLAEVDSVSFQKPSNIFKSDVQVIEDQLRSYIVRADSLTLILRPNTPSTLVPTKGELIVTMDCDKVLPYGFAGRVEATYKLSGDTLAVECSRPYLTEVFERLCVSEEATYNPTNDNTTPSQAREKDNSSWPPEKHPIELSSIGYKIALGNEAGLGGNFEGSYEMSVDAGIRTNKFDVYYTLYIDGPLNFYGSISAYGSHEAYINSSLSTSIIWKKDIPFQRIRNIRIPGAFEFFEFFEDLELNLEIGGELALNSECKVPFNTVMVYQFDTRRPVSIPPTFRVVPQHPVVNNQLEGSVSAYLGLKFDIGVALIAKEIAKTDAYIKGGFSLSSSMPLDTPVAPIENPNTEMYDELNKDDFFKVDFILEGGIESETCLDGFISGKLKENASIKIGPWNPIWTGAVVPGFDQVELRQLNNNHNLTASANVTRNLVFPTLIGFGLYDSKNKLVDYWWSDTPYKEFTSLKTTHTFNNLTPGVTYKVHPLVRLWKDNMVANPSAQIMATGIKTTLESMPSSTSAIISGKIVPFSNNIFDEYGIEYKEITSSEWISCPSNNISESGYFTCAIPDLMANIQYCARAYCRIGDEKKLGNEINFPEISLNPKYYHRSCYMYYRPDNTVGFSMKAKYDKISLPTGCIDYGNVLYRNGEIISAHSAKNNDKEAYIRRDMHVSEMTLDPANYTAYANKNTYETAVYLSFSTNKNDTVTIVSDQRKKINWVYKQKPEMYLYYVRLYKRCDDVEITVNNKTEYEHYHGFGYQTYYLNRGTLWLSHSPMDGERAGEFVQGVYDDYSIGHSFGWDAETPEDKTPFVMYLEFTDINGCVIRSNPVQISDGIHPLDGVVFDNSGIIPPELGKPYDIEE